MRAVCRVSVMEQAGNACPGHPPHLSPREELSAGELGGFILQVRAGVRYGCDSPSPGSRRCGEGAGAPADVQMCPGHIWRPIVLQILTPLTS